MLGKIVYEVHLTLGKALKYYWKLQALESIQTSALHEVLPQEEFTKLVDVLIDNFQIKDILAKAYMTPIENSKKCKGQTQQRVVVEIKQ